MCQGGCVGRWCAGLASAMSVCVRLRIVVLGWHVSLRCGADRLILVVGKNNKIKKVVGFFRGRGWDKLVYKTVGFLVGLNKSQWDEISQSTLSGTK